VIIFDLEGIRKRTEELEKKSQEPHFWKDNEKAQEVLKELTVLRKKSESWHRLSAQLEDASLLAELAQQENDQKALKEAEESLRQIDRELKRFEFTSMLSDEDDPKNALLVLLRMYTRWIEQKGFEYKTLDFLSGEEAGIKSTTLEVRGEYAYGFLKGESGVHRLVRISPFDANRRRHTSFSSVFVYPEIEDTITVEINEDDLKIDTFRSSGAGGQHVNKVSSAVRITHIPTGIMAQSQSERSQFRNKENAMKVLKSRLYQHYKEKEEEKLSEAESEKKKIEWGSQIRSYVFHPYNMVKDHRTGVETSNAQGVMDGDIDQFIQAYLSKRAE